MTPTNRMAHFKDGQSRIGLQIMLDAEGQEFVHWRGAWTHVSEVPLPKSHEDRIGEQVAPKRIPVIHGLVAAPENVPAFIPTSDRQRAVPIKA